MKNLPKDQSKELREDVLRAEVLDLTLKDTPEIQIAEQLGMTRYKVRKLRNSEPFKKALKEIAEGAKERAATSFKRNLDELAPIAFKALRQALNEGKLEGVRLFVEVAGLKEKEDRKPQDSTLHIHLPAGAVVENEKEAIQVNDYDIQDAE